MSIHLTVPSPLPTVVAAPPVALIELGAIGRGVITVDDGGLNVAGQVWYTPVAVGPGLTLVCHRARDARPPKARANDPSGAP